MAVMALLLDQDRCTKNFNIYWDRTGTNEWMLVSPGYLGRLLERPAAGIWHNRFCQAQISIDVWVTPSSLYTHVLFLLH